MRRGRFNFRGQRGRGGAHQRKAPQPIHSEEPSQGPQSQCPFPGWHMYLPDISYSQNSEHVTRLKALGSFLETHSFENETLDFIYDKRTFTVRVESLLSDEEVLRVWPGIKSSLYEEAPEYTIHLVSLAKHQNIVSGGQLQFKDKFPIIRARLVFKSQDFPFMDIKASLYGKLIILKGTVARVSNIKPLCSWMAFKCTSCAHVLSMHQPEGRYTTPKRCPQCKRGTFEPLRVHDKTITVDSQRIRLQELAQHESGRVPRSIEVDLSEDLCDASVPGDVVSLMGIVKTTTDPSVSFAPDGKNIFSIYIKAVSISNPRTGRVTESRGAQEDPDHLDETMRGPGEMGLKLTHSDFSAIRGIYDDYGKELFKGLVHSLCPSIYGHELVKAGLLLGLFGGTNKYSQQSNSIPVRGDPHVLVVGDPGLGKSQMLTACARVAPRGVFVTGNTTTTAGLTVTLTKDGSSDFTLEAGALILADMGHCCIDEFDKMQSQHQSLLETMEQQAVSVAKGGVVCTLPARAAVLAAANPVGGHYDRSRTVAENLKLNPALLSRFDLVFILIDQPNENLDQYLSDHIMHLHRNQSRSSALNPLPAAYDPPPDSSDLTNLKSRLKSNLGSCKFIPPDLMRKYIAYARRYVFPKLTPDACKVLQEFYLELRRERSSDLTPITLRQLESMIRLTEARAKLELREEASRSDAEDVIEIMKSSMVDVFKDQNGLLDFSRSQNGSGMSKRTSAKKFVVLLQKQASLQRKSIFSVDEMKSLAMSNGISTDKFYDFLASLNTQGYLLQKSAKSYKLLSSDY